MPFFTPQDLVPLANNNLGLRLTSNTQEVNNGGHGDAVPLSHLAGAKDIIEFLTLSFLSEPPKDQMEIIYKRYKQSDIRRNDCMPRLILHYAAKHGIDDAKKRLSYQNDDLLTALYFKLELRSIESEAQKLVSFYDSYKMTASLEFVTSQCPYLAQELAHNFNEKLLSRLKVNWDVYANSDDMDYLLLTNKDDDQKYAQCYDFTNYPLGKVGNHSFGKEHIKHQLKFLAGEHREGYPESETRLEERVFEAMKKIMKENLNESLSQISQKIKTKLSKNSQYPDNFKNACNKMVALVTKLQKNEQLSAEESIDLMKKTERLIDNPSVFRTFIAAAKNYRMVSGGELSAYMMLIAGWAAKIMTINYIGDAWIARATEKLELISTSQELANESQLCLTSP